jgi:hypothetical protein
MSMRRYACALKDSWASDRKICSQLLLEAIPMEACSDHKINDLEIREGDSEDVLLYKVLADCAIDHRCLCHSRIHGMHRFSAASCRCYWRHHRWILFPFADHYSRMCTVCRSIAQ